MSEIGAIQARWALFVAAERDKGPGVLRIQDYLYRSDIPNLFAEVDRLRGELQRSDGDIRNLLSASGTLGDIITQQNTDILAAAGMEMNEDGDADYQYAWFVVAGLRALVENQNTRLAQAQDHWTHVGHDRALGKCDASGLTEQECSAQSHGPAMPDIWSETKRLRAQVARARDVHQPIDAVHEGTSAMMQVCSGCGSDNGNWRRWPCPTVRALSGTDA